MLCEAPRVIIPPGGAPPRGGATLIAQDKSKGVTWMVALPPGGAANGSAARAAAAALPFSAGNHESAVSRDGRLLAVPIYESAAPNSTEGGGSPERRVVLLDVTTASPAGVISLPAALPGPKPHGAAWTPAGGLLVLHYPNPLAATRAAPPLPPLPPPPPPPPPPLEIALGPLGCSTPHLGIAVTPAGDIWVGALSDGAVHVFSLGAPPSLAGLAQVATLAVRAPLRLAHDRTTNTVAVASMDLGDALASMAKGAAPGLSAMTSFDAATRALRARRVVRTARGAVSAEGLTAAGGYLLTGGYNTQARVLLLLNARTLATEVEVHLPRCSAPQGAGLAGWNNWSGGVCPATARNPHDRRTIGAGGSPGGTLLRPAPSLVRAASGAPDQPRQLWLDAWADPVAGISAFSSCIHTCNLLGDGDWRLVVWKGTQRASEHALLGAPTALTSFVPGGPPPRAPVLAVASGCHVYMFKALKPYYKFTLPLLPCSGDEEQLWQQLDAGALNPSAASATLSALRGAGVPLSDRGAALLSQVAAKGEAGAAAFAAESRGQPPSAPSCLVLGTEDGRVLILNSAGTVVQQAFDLGAPPSFLALSGSLDSGLKLSATTRDGRLHLLARGGSGSGGGGGGDVRQQAVQLEAQPVGLVRTSNAALVGVMSDTVHCYGGRGGGARQYSLPQPAPILCMRLLETHTSRLVKALIVALANGEVRVYHERALVSSHVTASAAPVMRLAFGRYAREDNTLVAIMPRTANLEAPAAAGGPPPEQDVPLPVPAKTRLYRERESAVDMHRLFQRDLVTARLATARALVKVLTDGQGSSSHASACSLSMSASVHGLGPRFRLVLAVTNEGRAAVGGLAVALRYDPGLYSVGKQQLEVPLLVPMLQYELSVDIRCLRPDAGAGEVRLVMVPACGGAPLMAALVRMPVSEPEDV
ncbi:MAG: ciliary BBSome complex subunit 1-domain-containing protein [Monoraphidium minutum]|nr:MAG: ciliary BBSome complex subunit 1-domain-containing protein [Monoraphidium minutum]